MRIPCLPVMRALLLAGGLAVAGIAPAAAQYAPLSDTKLQAFVTAALKVSDLIDQWTPKIQAATTPEEKAQLKQTANAQLVEAIQSSGGMTVEEYQQIGQTAEADPALQKRIVDILQANAGKPQ